MQCRHCGTEIADKALICYRCGEATVAPRLRPATITPRRRWSQVVSGLLVVGSAGIYLSGGVPDIPVSSAGWVIGAAGLALAAWGWRRR